MEAGCKPRYFPTPEICMILERFSALIFLGDDITKSIYTAFNILLRDDYALGGLQSWMMNTEERETCQCVAQFMNEECVGYAVRSSEDWLQSQSGHHDSDGGKAYFCSRMLHPTDLSEWGLTRNRSSPHIHTHPHRPRITYLNICVQISHIWQTRSLAAKPRCLFAWSRGGSGHGGCESSA